MKKLLTILLIIGVLLQSGSQVVIVAQYYANKDYIAKNLCENRNRPAMHCEGKCCLKKRLAKESKESQSPRNQREEQVTLFFETPSINIHYPAPASVGQQYDTHNDAAHSGFSPSIFHPPGA